MGKPLLTWISFCLSWVRKIFACYSGPESKDLGPFLRLGDEKTRGRKGEGASNGWPI